MKKITTIILGWYYWITNRNNELAKSRLKICLQCSDRRGVICNLCGCFLNAKTRIEDEACPIEKW